MPLPLGPFVGFALGVLLALFAPRASLPDAGPAHPRPRLLVALFAALVFAPVCAYFLAFAGDWSIAYLTDSRAIPSALLLILVALDALSVVVGFSVGRGSHRSLRAVTALIGVPLGAVLIFIVLFFGRLRVDGTFHQVRGDFGTQPVAGGPLGYALVWMFGLLAAGFGLTLRLLREPPRPRIADAPPPNAPLMPRKRPPDAPARFPRRPGIYPPLKR